MTIQIQISDKLSEILKRVSDNLNSSFKSQASNSMTRCIKEHIHSRFPSSKHWDVSKVTNGTYSNNTAETIVDIPGASRAYNDITIRPKYRNYLAIPIHRSAYGHSPIEFDNLFIPKNKNVLALNDKGALVFMFALSKSAYQRKDSTLLPSDSTLVSSIISSIVL